MLTADHFFERIETSIGVDYMLRAREGVPPQGVYIRPHVHLEHEIMWFRRAEGFFSIGSEKFRIKDNTLVFVSSMMLHDMELSCSGDHERFLLQYDTAVLNRLKYPFPVSSPHAGFIMQLAPQQAERVQFLFTWLTELHEDPDSLNQVDPLLVLLLNTVLTHGESADKVVISEENNSTFDNIIGFVVQIEKTKKFSTSLNEAAEYCQLSTSHFSRSFKKIMQISFKEYLVRKKIAQSAELLRNTDLSITDIAYQCEFTDSAYYCFKFRALMGVTPKKFRSHSRSTKQLSTKHDVVPPAPTLS
jgi:AraC-like DNA-binding protein